MGCNMYGKECLPDSDDECKECKITEHFRGLMNSLDGVDSEVQNKIRQEFLDEFDERGYGE